MALSYADIASTIALGLSVIAIYQSASHRTRDMRIQAQADLAEIRRGLELAPQRITEAANLWTSALAARGMIKSGVADQKNAEADALMKAATALSDELEGITVPKVPILSSLVIDRCATRVSLARGRWRELDASIEGMANDAKENRELLRKR